LVGRSTLY
jgi:hypothetical protein